MERLLGICLGGAAGTAARYGIGVWAAGRFAGPFPAGTVIVNLTEPRGRVPSGRWGAAGGVGPLMS